jgi:hypothetical protein
MISAPKFIILLLAWTPAIYIGIGGSLNLTLKNAGGQCLFCADESFGFSVYCNRLIKQTSNAVLTNGFVDFVPFKTAMKGPRPGALTGSHRSTRTASATCSSCARMQLTWRLSKLCYMLNVTRIMLPRISARSRPSHTA